MATDSKRRYSPQPNGNEIVVKRPRVDGHSLAIKQNVTKEGFRRTSGLDAPIMLLEGHADEVFTCRFNPDGDVLASGSNDKHIFLWRTYGECENYMVLKGHKNAVLEVQWTTDSERILSASPDKTVRAWDAITGQQVKKAAEHTNFVNSCCPLRHGPPMFVSGSDDATVKVWDLRVRRSVQTLSERFQILAVSFSDAGDQVYSAGIETLIKAWDLRKSEPVLTLAGHSDSVTGLRLSPDGNSLLSNSMDNTIRIWDVKPFGAPNRCLRVLSGHLHTLEKNLLRCDWSPDATKVTGGSGDRNVYIWDTTSGSLKYRLPGHKGSVNDVAFHPKEPIVASASSDKTIYMGELAS
eukprot:jgi/Botrbrau1/5933/Bobra.0366s0107.1